MGACIPDRTSTSFSIKSMRGRYHAGGKITFTRKPNEKQTSTKIVQTC